MPYNLTCMWNLMNKIETEAWMRGYLEQTHGYERKEGFEGLNERR